LGLLLHLLSGSVLLPVGFLALPADAVPGPPVLRGMLWAGCLWLALESLIAPLLGAGVFSAALGGLPAALRALLGYLVYGATLGGIVGAPVVPSDNRVRRTGEVAMPIKTTAMTVERREDAMDTQIGQAIGRMWRCRGPHGVATCDPLPSSPSPPPSSYAPPATSTCWRTACNGSVQQQPAGQGSAMLSWRTSAVLILCTFLLGF